MIDVATLSVIRRWALREHLSIREIARRTGLSRNTIRKYLRADVVQPRLAPRKFAGKLEPFTQKLSGWLRIEASRSRKQRRTVKQMFEDLQSLGYTGSYSRVAAYARAHKMERQSAQQTAGKGVFVPLVFAAGEAFQFDWSEDWAVVEGVRTKLQIAHFKLSHSKAFYLRAYPQQTHEMLFDAHNRAFAVFGGIPARGIYDNMRTAVDRVGRGKLREVNARFSAMASHFLFEVQFCNPASGWEKGQVEKNVRDARHRIWQSAPAFASLEVLNEWLEHRCLELWQEINHGLLPGSVSDAWQQEKAALMPMPRPFDGFVEHAKRVSPTCLVHFERNRYSVPAPYANRPVSLHVYVDRLVVVAEGNVVCEHPRIIERNHQGPGRTIYDWHHYLAVLQRKPGALRNGAPFLEMPHAFRALQAQLLKQPGGDREMVEILALVLQHDEQAVLAAVELALEDGVARKVHIINILHRLIDGAKPHEPITSPQALSLSVEPLANVVRYDQLRQVRHAS